jgi:hypothetical protein
MRTREGWIEIPPMHCQVLAGEEVATPTTGATASARSTEAVRSLVACLLPSGAGGLNIPRQWVPVAGEFPAHPTIGGTGVPPAGPGGSTVGPPSKGAG